jgi:hypothetical protein
LYVFGDRLDDDPWMLLTWRGRTRQQLLGHLRAPGPDAASAIAPWWPFVPGAPLPDPHVGADTMLATDAPSDTAAVLRRCAPLAVDVRGEPVTDLLLAAYNGIVDVPTDAAR